MKKLIFSLIFISSCSTVSFAQSYSLSSDGKLVETRQKEETTKYTKAQLQEMLSSANDRKSQLDQDIQRIQTLINKANELNSI